MKISVAMASYNGEKYIEEQLDSIFEQTMEPDEVIICDDCSKDGTVKKIEEYCDRKKRSVKLVRNETNLGFADNFNKALGLAEGEYIFFSDQDDIWDEKKIETMIGIMEKHGDCRLLCSDYEPFIAGENAPSPPKRIMKRMPNDGSLEKVSLTKKGVYLRALGCCMCLRRDFKESIKDYWFDGWAQDDRFWRMAVCEDGCYLLHSNLVKHRIHDSNTATYGNYHNVDKRLRLYDGVRRATEQMLKYARENGLDREKTNILKKSLKTVELRIELIKEKKFANAVALLGYLGYYEVKKSYLVDMKIALKEKRK